MIQRVQANQPRGFEQQNRDTTAATNLQNTVPSAGNEDEQTESEPAEKRTANRGFASMDRDKQKRIASEGGRAAHKQGVAHEWSKDEAREAGRKGGQIVSQNRNHMSEIGRKGGQNSGQRRQRSE